MMILVVQIVVYHSGKYGCLSIVGSGCLLDRVLDESRKAVPSRGRMGGVDLEGGVIFLLRVAWRRELWSCRRALWGWALNGSNARRKWEGIN